MSKKNKCQIHQDTEAYTSCHTCGGKFCESCLKKYVLPAYPDVPDYICKDCESYRYADYQDMSKERIKIEQKWMIQGLVIGVIVCVIMSIIMGDEFSLPLILAYAIWIIPACVSFKILNNIRKIKSFFNNSDDMGAGIGCIFKLLLSPI